MLDREFNEVFEIVIGATTLSTVTFSSAVSVEADKETGLIILEILDIFDKFCKVLIVDVDKLTLPVIVSIVIFSKAANEFESKLIVFVMVTSFKLLIVALLKETGL
jgi:hypothetical protein